MTSGNKVLKLTCYSFFFLWAKKKKWCLSCYLDRNREITVRISCFSCDIYWCQLGSDDGATHWQN